MKEFEEIEIREYLKLVASTLENHSFLTQVNLDEADLQLIFDYFIKIKEEIDELEMQILEEQDEFLKSILKEDLERKKKILAKVEKDNRIKDRIQLRLMTREEQGYNKIL